MRNGEVVCVQSSAYFICDTTERNLMKFGIEDLP